MLYIYTYKASKLQYIKNTLNHNFKLFLFYLLLYINIPYFKHLNRVFKAKHFKTIKESFICKSKPTKTKNAQSSKSCFVLVPYYLDIYIPWVKSHIRL